MIWFKEYTLEQVNARGKNTMAEHLNIVVDELGPNFLKGRMPVDHRTVQPLGLLHGGASAAFAETLASIGAFLCINPEKEYCVGLEINANHIAGVKSGEVVGLARPLHRGRSTQVWDIHITQETKLVCVSRLTMAVIAKK